MKAGYYWTIRKSSLQSDDYWSEPKPEYFPQEFIDLYEEGCYDPSRVQIISRVLTVQDSERLKRELDECRKNNEVLKRRLLINSSCTKGY